VSRDGTEITGAELRMKMHFENLEEKVTNHNTRITKLEQR